MQGYDIFRRGPKDTSMLGTLIIIKFHQEMLLAYIVNKYSTKQNVNLFRQ